MVLNFGPKLKLSKALSMNFQLIESKAFSKSIVKIMPGVFCNSLYIRRSSICLMLHPINLPLIYPVWSSFMIYGIPTDPNFFGFATGNEQFFLNGLTKTQLKTKTEWVIL